MKNKLFLALSLLTAGLNATFLENSVAPQTSFSKDLAYTSARGFTLGNNPACSEWLKTVPAAQEVAKAQYLRNLTMSTSALKLAPFAALAAAGAAYESFNTATPVVQLSNMQKARNFVSTHKVATGAGLSAIVGLGVAYKYRKSLFGKAQGQKAKGKFGTKAKA